MPVELRKRKEAPPPPPPAKKRAPSKSKDKADAPKIAKPAAVEEKAVVAEDAPVAAPAVTADAAPKGGIPKVGDKITLESFGGEVETNAGEKTTLAKLVEQSKAGVVLFTYPKASTPGCKYFAAMQGANIGLMRTSHQAQHRHACSATHMSP